MWNSHLVGARLDQRIRVTVFFWMGSILPASLVPRSEDHTAVVWDWINVPCSYGHIPVETLERRFTFIVSDFLVQASLVVETVKNLQETGFDSWFGKIPWRRAWQPTPVFLPRESHGQRSLAGCSPWGRKESGMTERLSTFSYSIKNVQKF